MNQTTAFTVRAHALLLSKPDGMYAALVNRQMAGAAADVAAAAAGVAAGAK